jgi:YbgC/YbaW family acyl-CoA thioester hydrolase
MKMSNSRSENIEWNVYEMIVAWHESDPAGIAFHGNYLFWLERAFMSLLSNRGCQIESMGSTHKIGFPVTLVECRYLKPIPVWTKIRILMGISPRSHLTKIVTPFKITMSRTDEIAAEGEIQRRIVSLDSFQLVECPEDLRRIFGLS